MEFLLTVLLMVVLLLLKGFFSGSEIALVNADKIKLRHRAKLGHKGSKLAADLLRTPDILLSSTLVGTNLSTIALTTIGTLLMFEIAGDRGDIFALLIYTPLFLIFGEIVPKSVYQHKSDALTPVIIYPLRWTSLLFAPVIFVFSRAARLAARLVGAGKVEQTLSVTREQLKTLVEIAEHGSAMSAIDRGSVRRVMRFADTTVGEAMIPIAEVTALSVEDTVKTAVQLIRKRGYNRLPVHNGHSTNVTGVLTLTTWDLMAPDLMQRSLSDLVTVPLYVSQLQTIDKLLPVLRTRKDRMAIVVDEFGAAIGMITMEDIVEEVVGEIDVGYDFDEYLPKRQRTVEMIEDGVWVMDARLPISEANELLVLNLAGREFHTVGGLLMQRLRRIPEVGESIDESGYRFTVVEGSPRVVEKVRVERSPVG